MKPRLFAMILGSALIATLAGCAQAPEQEMHVTRTALDAAKKAGAEQYALSAYKAAEISYELALKQISEENRKLPFMRKYTKILETLGSARMAAESAQAEVVKVKDRLQGETREMLGATRSLADSTEYLMQATSRKKAADSLAGSLDSVRSDMKDAEDALSTRNFLLAREKASLVHGRATALLAVAEKLPVKKVRSRSKAQK